MKWVMRKQLGHVGLLLGVLRVSHEKHFGPYTMACGVIIDCGSDAV